GRYSEGRWWHAPVGYSDGRRPDRSGGCPTLLGAVSGAGVPHRFLWLQARPICDRCRTPNPSALLALRLGARHRRQRLLRQYRLGAVAQGGPSSYELPWVMLYIERWLKAPVQMEEGSVVPRTAGTPQGGVISPLLANLFLHYAFDAWMSRNYPHIPFERYADDAICHCKSAEEARALWSALQDRFAACKLVLHPEKTKIVYCKDANRRGDFPNQSFDFLGFTSRARKALGRGRRPFACFLPAASPKALTSIS